MADIFCRDWTSTLRRAAYRGVGFFVEHDSIDVGRRLVVHEFPNGDQPYIEDMGAKATHITVMAYVATDLIEIAEEALRSACSLGGPGVLDLPLYNCLAHCEDCKRDYHRDQQGYIAFHLKFIRQGVELPALAALELARAIEFVSGTLATADAFVKSFRTLGLPTYVLTGAVQQFGGFLADVSAAARSQPWNDVANGISGLLRTASDAVATAGTLCAVGDAGDSWSNTSFRDTGGAAALDAPIAAVVQSIFDQARLGLDAQTAADFAAQFVAWGDAPAQPVTPSDQFIAANTVAMNALVRSTALACYATAITQVDFADVRDCRQARADLDEYFANALSDMAGWGQYAVWAQLGTIRANAVQHLSGLVASLAPVLEVSANRTMPSLWWANRLYGDANRATELVQRNGVVHPSFMPPIFEALAR